MPQDLEKIFARFKKVIVCEWNKGQLWRLLRAEYLLPALSYTKVQGTPFTTTELEAAFERALNENAPPGTSTSSAQQTNSPQGVQ